MEGQNERKRVHTDASVFVQPTFEKSLTENYKSVVTTQPPSSDIIEIKELIPYNKRALAKSDTTYKLETFEQNFLLVFNQTKIDGYEPRYGTEKDVAAIKQTFVPYGFEVHVRDDLTKSEIFKELKIFAEKDFTDYGCVAMIVLTHGSKGGLLRAKDQQYSEKELIKQFKTNDKPTLLTKPKILIIQACRGQVMSPVVFTMKEPKIRKDEDVEHYYSLPVEADIIVLHSSYMGSPSFRDEDDGSWFIQTLCREIGRLSPNTDLESITTEVKRAVAIDMEVMEYNNITRDMEIYKQMPVVSSTLLRKLYLRKYGQQSTDVLFTDNNTDTASNPLLQKKADTASNPLLQSTETETSTTSCFGCF